MEQETLITQNPVLNEADFAICKWLVKRGIANSMSGLSRMLGEELSVIDLDIRQITLRETLQSLGGPDNVVIGIHLDINGDTDGHLLLIHDHQLAFQLINYQMGSNHHQTNELGEVELSLLSEMGNIVGAFFLNVLADATDLVLSPSPPLLNINKAKIVIKDAADRLINGQHTQFIVKAAFNTESKEIHGTFLVVPTIDLINCILEHARNM